MADDNARKKLLDLIDHKAFDPVLNADPKDYPESQRNKLNDVQSTTRSTKKRYHDSYETAHDVYLNYKRDLSSAAAEDVSRELRDLDLPTLTDIKDEVEKKAHDLGVA